MSSFTCGFRCQIGNGGVHGREQLVELCRGDGRERETDKPREDYRSDGVLRDEVPAHLLGVDTDGPYAHEVSRVERHDLEVPRVLGMGLQYDAYLVVALLEDGELLALLRDIAGILERIDCEVLADGVHVGDAGAHVARGLRLERLELVGRRPLEREAHEADAHAPDVVLLRRAVELYGKDVAVQVGEFREKRLVKKAWGFAHLYDSIPQRQRADAREAVHSVFGSGNGPYYRAHHGEIMLSPEMQEKIIGALGGFCSKEDVKFDHYVTVWDFD